MDTLKRRAADIQNGYWVLHVRRAVYIIDPDGNLVRDARRKGVWTFAEIAAALNEARRRGVMEGLQRARTPVPKRDEAR